MAKIGTPNSFLKGMNSDVDPAGQPKDSYRYAKNIRLASFQGKNVSVQPYDSDRIALTLSADGVATGQSSSISNILNWQSVSEVVVAQNSSITVQGFITWLSEVWGGLDLEQLFTQGSYSTNFPYFATGNGVLASYTEEENGGNGPYDLNYFASVGEFKYIWQSQGQNNSDDLTTELEYGNGQIAPAMGPGSPWAGMFELFQEQNTILPVDVSVGGQGPNNSDGIGITFNVVLIMDDENEVEIDIVAPPFSEVNDAVSNPIYFETIIANSITSADNNLVAVVTNIGGGNAAWAFQCEEGYVSSVTISATGYVNISTNMTAVYDWGSGGVELQDAPLWNAWMSVFEQYLTTNNLYYGNPNYYNNISSFESQFNGDFAGLWDTIGRYMVEMFSVYLSSDTFTNIGNTVVEVSENNISTFTPALPLQGTVSSTLIADGMQILGHYAFSDYLVLLGTWEGNEQVSGYPSDFILKTSQKKDGTLHGVGEGGIYELYFLGNLEFENKKKLKVVGAEENENIRRIYFTDGDMPLRTMNVAAPSSEYSAYTNDPGFFDLFMETKISVPEVTGFISGGNLESISHAYCFRYKSRD